MALIFSSYHQTGVPEEDSNLLAGYAVSQSFKPVVNVKLSGIDVWMKKQASLTAPLTLLIGTSEFGSQRYSTTISSAMLSSSFFERIRIPLDSLALVANSTYWVTLLMPGAGEAQYRRCTSAPPNTDSVTLSGCTLRQKASSGTISTISSKWLSFELVDTQSAIVAARSAPVYRQQSSNWLVQREQQVLSQVYPGGMNTPWLFDDYVLPVMPARCMLKEQTMITTHKLMDARKVHILEQSAVSPRIVTGYVIDMEFGIVGRDFVVWLQQFQEFDRNVFVQIGLLDPPYPEIGYMADVETSSLYLKRYWGTAGSWREDSSTVKVYVNDLLQSSATYTIDYIRGCITFSSPRLLADVVTLTYVWRPAMRVSVEPNWFATRGVIFARPKVTLTEVDISEL